MLTIEQFVSEWKRLHHPSMDVDGDVAFFYEIYDRLHRLVEQEAAAFDEQIILSLLLYTENTIAVGLDGVYEYRYRSAAWAMWFSTGAKAWAWTRKPHHRLTGSCRKSWRRLPAVSSGSG